LKGLPAHLAVGDYLKSNQFLQRNRLVHSSAFDLFESVGAEDAGG